MAKPTKARSPRSIEDLEIPERLHAGMRILVLTDDDGPISGTVFEGNQVDLDRRSESLTHLWPADDAFGRSTRVEVHPARCRVIPPDTCEHCGQTKPAPPG